MLQQLQPENTVLNTFRALRVAKAIDRGVLELALSEVARRQDVLRTNFRIIDGVPMQVIRPPEPVSVGMVDFSSLPANERDAAFVRWSRKRTVEPFDLAAGELLRADLVRLGAEDHVIFFNLHHIICDGWSLGVIVRETMTLYNAFSQGKPSPLPPLPVQYGDYAAWQRSKLQGDAIERQLAFWKTHLADAPTSTDLPFDRPRPPDRSFRGQRRGVSLEPALVTRLRLLCQREQTTLFTVMISALATLFHRYSGANDILIGSPVANRGFREVEPLIGLFINTVTFRFDFRGDPSFKDFLARVRAEAMDVFNNQDVPFERVLDELGIKREKDRSPLFQTMVAMQPPRAASVVAELGVDPAVLTPRGAKFDFTLVLWESEDGDVGGVIEYATDLFEPATIERMFEHYLRLLEGITADPRQRVSALPMLSDDERREAIAEGSGAVRPYPQTCLHELVAEQAARTPDAVALIFGDQRITYRTLDERANQLAWHLRSLGVGPDAIVGLCMRRSPELVVGLLGILKAGGAYLPLDPGYPSHRLAHMIRDARPPVLVTEAPLLGALPSHALQQSEAKAGGIDWSLIAAVATLRRVPNRVRVDADAAAIAALPTTAPPVGTHPDNLAYLLYTSGSTGRPKGVMGTHRAVVNRLYWDVGPERGGEVYVQKTTPNFIDYLWEIFMPLLRGQSAVIVPEDVARDPERLIDLLAREEATRIVLVPSLLRAILDNPKDLAQRLPKLRHWACSGEPLSAPLAAAFRSKLPHADLFNIYGTSEFWDATWFAASARNAHGGVPIGLPIANMQAHVVHGGHEPVPANVAGELFIGGDGLARGYLNNPAMTAERFLPDPFGDGTRIYRSGDLARRLPDGVLEFIGRKDRQIKLRGHRIELAEIERALEQHPIVRHATVQLRHDLPGGEPGLVAYVAADAGVEAEPAVRSHLQAKLPSHMIPLHFVFLPKLPLTPNGKVDRAALPPPQPKQEQSRKHVAPKTEAERMLAGIWGEILGVRDIGIDDNFFEHGGDSLMLVRVQAVICERLRRDIPVTMLFRYPTIRALSSYLAEGQKSDGLAQSMSRGEARKKFLARRGRQ